MDLTVFLWIVAAGIGVSQAAACTGGWYTVFQPWHKDTVKRWKNSGHSPTSKLGDLLGCPFCQSFWYAVVVVAALGPEGRPHSIVTVFAVWGMASLALKSQWSK